MKLWRGEQWVTVRNQEGVDIGDRLRFVPVFTEDGPSHIRAFHFLGASVSLNSASVQAFIPYSALCGRGASEANPPRTPPPIINWPNDDDITFERVLRNRDERKCAATPGYTGRTAPVHLVASGIAPDVRFLLRESDATLTFGL